MCLCNYWTLIPPRGPSSQGRTRRTEREQERVGEQRAGYGAGGRICQPEADLLPMLCQQEPNGSNWQGSPNFWCLWATLKEEELS